MQLYIKPSSNVPKFKQIAEYMAAQITSGELGVGEKLPSIDTISQSAGVARQTVVQAYKRLKAHGLIASSKTRGFFVQTNTTSQRLRVLVLFNIMSASKEQIYHAIENELKERAHIELFFYNYNFEVFENIIRSKADMFHYFIVMPHHEPATIPVLQFIAPERLILIDRPLPDPIEGVSSIHQDFKLDVYEALTRGLKKISRYKKIVLLFPNEKNLPAGIKDGVKKFGAAQKMQVVIAETAGKNLLQDGTLFITATDEQLIHLIELQQQTKLKPGKNIGIISYNESPLKRILSGGISTLSSDFELMGRTAAQCILQKTTVVKRNPFTLTIRNSL